MTRLINTGQTNFSRNSNMKVVVPETMYTTLVGDKHSCLDSNINAMFENRSSAMMQLHHQIGRLPSGTYTLDNMEFDFFKTEYRVPTINGNTTIQVISAIYGCKVYPIVLKIPDNGVWRPFIISLNMMELCNDSGIKGFRHNILEGVPFLCNLVTPTQYNLDQFFILNGGIIPITDLHKIGNRLAISFANHILVDPSEMCQYIIGPSMSISDIIGILTDLPVSVIDITISPSSQCITNPPIVMNDMLYDVLMQFFILPIEVYVFQDQYEYYGSIYDVALSNACDSFYDTVDGISTSLIVENLRVLHPELEDYNVSGVEYNPLHELVSVFFSGSSTKKSDIEFTFDLMTLLMYNPCTCI